MKYDIADVLKVAHKQYDIYEYVVLFEQAEKAARAVKMGKEYTTPDYYTHIMCATFSGQPFPDAIQHSAGFYYYMH